jgi:hypothetical protein
MFISVVVMRLSAPQTVKLTIAAAESERIENSIVLGIACNPAFETPGAESHLGKAKAFEDRDGAHALMNCGLDAGVERR